MIIDKSLYGLKTSSARFHEHLSEKLKLMGYKPSKAYPDLWYKRMTDHYEYIARYVDDVISFSKDPLSIMEELKKTYVMKAIGTPEYYLGGNVIQLGEE
jgi:ribonucleotide reductase alpha subunit